MQIKMFGIAREIVNGSSIEIAEGIHSVAELRTSLVERYPAFSTLKGFMIAVNQTYAEDSDQLNPSDEIAIIPPVSGG